MARTLALTSPTMRGADVTALQKLLDGGNVFKQDFLYGEVDGEFGPETARAVIRAKFWLGYLQAQQKPYAGDMLRGYLTGKKKLPADQARRRAARLKAKAKEPLRLKALRHFETHLGEKERPAGSNVVYASKWYELIGPWCMESVTEAYVEGAGSKAFKRGERWAYCPWALQAATRGEHGLAVVRWQYALPGDVLFFDWDRDGVADHVGLLREKIDSIVELFSTIEGNTAVGADSDGGEVMHRDRAISQVATYHGMPAFVRVGR